MPLRELLFLARSDCRRYLGSDGFGALCKAWLIPGFKCTVLMRLCSFLAPKPPRPQRFSNYWRWSIHRSWC